MTKRKKDFGRIALPKGKTANERAKEHVAVIQAAQRVLNNWSSGNLAEAVTELGRTINYSPTPKTVAQYMAQGHSQGSAKLMVEDDKRLAAKKTADGGTRTKFLVVSYDSDQQEWFYDHVMASSEESAEAFVCENRPYVVDADATDVSQFQDMAHAMNTQTEKDFLGSMVQLAKQHAEEIDEPYVPTNYWDANGNVIAKL
jgi:hypothetical protein